MRTFGIRRVAVLGVLAVAAFLPPGAGAHHSWGATYSGPAAGGGSVEFTVSADGAAVTSFKTTDVVTSCGTITGTTTGSLPINHSADPAFSYGTASSTLRFSGSFPSDLHAQGTLTSHTIFPSCTSDPVSWTATTTTPPPPSAYTLTVARNGSGSGTITSSPPGITCGAMCSASFAVGQSVTLTASPATGSQFAGWSGCDNPAGNTCTLVMNAARMVTATFNTIPSPPTPPKITISAPISVRVSDLLCGVKRGVKRCNGLVVKGTFPRSGSATWAFEAYKPGRTPMKRKLGSVKKSVSNAGTVSIVYKLKAGKATTNLYSQIKRHKLTSVRVTLQFTAPGISLTKTTNVRLQS